MVLRPRHGLSLCAGGGGFDLGLMLAEPGYHSRAFVECDAYPRSVLIAAQNAGYFAPAPIWDDIRSFDAKPFRGAFDTVLAGYPCQPFSAAGKRRGASDPRHLWPDIARIIGECRPEWVFCENVAGHVSLGLETVLRQLWRMGYVPAAGLFSAAEVGAPHRRERIFILAHTDEPASRQRPLQRSGQQRLYTQGQKAGTEDQQLVHTQGNGWREGWAGAALRVRRNTAASGTGVPLANPGGAKLEGLEPGQHHSHRWQVPDESPALPGRARIFPPGPSDHAAWAEILIACPDLAPALGLNDCLTWARHLATTPEGPQKTAAESALHRMADGLALRPRALRLLGNGVHPLAAAYAWRSLATAHGLRPVDMDTTRSVRTPGADGSL